jgi:hypothetical protein
MNDKFISEPMPAESTEEFTLLRLLDTKYKPNRILLIVLSFIFFATFGWYIYKNSPFSQSLYLGLIQTVLVFICWTIGRELDPDNDYAAFLGIPLLFLPFSLTQGNIFVLLWFLISIRLINQTTGKKTTSSDVTFYLFLSILSAILSTQILIFPLSILIIVLTSAIPSKQIQLSILSIPLIPSFILFFLVFPKTWILLNPSPWILIYIAVSCALMFFVTITTDHIDSKGDRSFSPLSLKRVQSSQIIAVLSVLMISTFHGSILSVFPVWAAITGVGIFRLFHFFINKDE